MKIKTWLFNQIDLIMFILIIFIKLLIFNYSLNLVDNQAKYLMIGCLGSALILASIFSFATSKKRVKGMIIGDFIISLILFIDVVYNRYFYDVTSVALIKQAKLAAEVKSSVTALLKPTDIIIFLDIVIFMYLYVKFKEHIKINNFKLSFKVIQFLSLALLGFLLSFNSVKALEKEQPGITKTMYDKKYVVKRIGNINFHIFDFYRYITSNVLKRENLTEEEKQNIKSYLDEKNKIENPKYFGEMKGKNLIIVQIEAFQGFLLNKKINGQEITPNLNKLAKDCLVFDNFFYQTAFGGTSDAEFIVNNSLLPIKEGSVYYQYAGNEYDSLPKNMKRNGYYTAVLHANRPGFWNRSNMYKTLGFDKYESELNFKIDDIQGLGLSDKSFFKQAVTKMKDYPKPFYSFLITLSSHYPYKDSNDKLKDIIKTGEFEGTIIGDYIKSAKYTDQAIGEFIDLLKQEGLWENSVVVFYGDHYAIPYDQKSTMGKLLYNRDSISDLEWQEAQKVVSMIHFPNEKIKGNVDEVTGQYDLYPTIANLFGFNASYTLGRDVLNSDKGFVVLRNGIWSTDDVMYLNWVDKVVDRKTGKDLNKNNYKYEFEKAYNILKTSDGIIENNLIKYFKNETFN